MSHPLAQVQPFIYTNAKGLKLEVLFVLDPEKKGYINATAIAKQFGKEPKDWLRNGNVQEYIKSLIKKINYRSANSPTETKSIGYDDLVVAMNGGPLGNYGTWLHPKLAVVFARWLSPDFAVWCDDVIAEILHNHTKSPQQFPELAELFTQALAGINQRLDQQEQRSDQRFFQLDQRFSQLDQRLVQQAENAQQALKQTREWLNGIGGAISGLQNIALFQPMNIQERVERVIVKYQDALEAMLHTQQDELIQSYLIGIKENLSQIAQRVPQIGATESLNTPISQEVKPDTESEFKPEIEPEIRPASSLINEIHALRAAGKSWNGISQLLNAQGTPTPSGKGQWYGSSVKRYVELHAPV